MCVIVASDDEHDQPTLEVLKKCFQYNSDGAGVMWLDDDTVQIKKGFMKWEDFKEFWKEMNFQDEDLVVFHFRKASSGGVRKEMCHPFPITNNEDLLKKTSLQCEMAMMHNGVLGSAVDGMSDTAGFIRDSISKLNDPLEDGVFDLIADATKGNNLCFLDSQPRIGYTGRWDEEENVKFSNLRWKTTSQAFFLNHPGKSLTWIYPATVISLLEAGVPLKDDDEIMYLEQSSDTILVSDGVDEPESVEWRYIKRWPPSLIPAKSQRKGNTNYSLMKASMKTIKEKFGFDLDYEIRRRKGGYRIHLKDQRFSDRRKRPNNLGKKIKEGGMSRQIIVQTGSEEIVAMLMWAGYKVIDLEDKLLMKAESEAADANIKDFVENRATKRYVVNEVHNPKLKGKGFHFVIELVRYLNDVVGDSEVGNVARMEVDGRGLFSLHVENEDAVPIFG